VSNLTAGQKSGGCRIIFTAGLWLAAFFPADIFGSRNFFGGGGQIRRLGFNG